MYLISLCKIPAIPYKKNILNLVDWRHANQIATYASLVQHD